MKTLSIACLAACSGASPQPPHEPVTAPAAERVPATFTRLFERGAKWTFATAVTTFEPQIGSNATKETRSTGTLTCEVTYAGAARQRWESTLTCTATPALPHAFPLELVATPAGLWELDRHRPDVAPKPETRLIGHPPQPSNDYVEHAEAEGSRRATVTHSGSRWCFGESFAMAGQTGGWTLCLRDGDLVGGTSEGSDGMKSITMRWGDADP
jgi:hypothetical protein